MKNNYCQYQKISTDVVVVGAGAAGCFAAIKASEIADNVLLVSKCPIGKGGATEVAESFLQAPFGHEDPNDNPQIHFEDIIKGGYLIADRRLAKALADDICDRIMDLEKYGLGFAKTEEGKMKQYIAAGLSYPRSISPAQGGAGIMKTLYAEVRRRPSIKVLEDIQVFRCLQDKRGNVCGLAAIDRCSGEKMVISSKAVVLTTGGNGAIWEQSDVPPDLIGDGMYMAYHAGAGLVDMEMVLYYPTVIVAPSHIRGVEIPGEMILRRTGAKLLNILGEDFVGEDIPVRDKLSRLIFNEVAAGRGTKHGGVILNVSKSHYSKDEALEIILTSLRAKYLYLKNKGVDILEQTLEVAPMVHFTIGGIRIDQYGQTDIPGLFAGGEVAANCHGANRLAGNALADALVFGARAGKAAAEFAAGKDYMSPDEEIETEIMQIIEKPFSKPRGKIKVSEIKNQLKSTASELLGPIRTGKGVIEGRKRIEELKEKMDLVGIGQNRRWNMEWFDYLDTLAMIDIAEIVAGSALLRTESRGHHWRADYPAQNDKEWIKHTYARKTKGNPVFEIIPVEGV